MYLKLASLNVEGAIYNKLPIQHLIKDFNVVALQEHWLYNFEASSLDSIVSPNCLCYVKSVDDHNPISAYQRPRGFGGVAFIWNSTINHLITTYPDGSSHIIIICLELPTEKDLCIINVYMPCRGSAQREHNFRESLDELYELHTKFSVNHHVILCGDMNASLLNIWCTRDNLFQNWIKNTGLILPAEFPRNPTHYHHNGLDASSIDYILTTPNIADTILDVDILDLSVNTSPHNPVILNTSIELSSITHKQLPISPVKKHMWDKGNLEAYKQHIYMNQSCVQPTSPADIDLYLNTITALLSHAGIINITTETCTEEKDPTLVTSYSRVTSPP